jgi:hypothetical protein
MYGYDDDESIGYGMLAASEALMRPKHQGGGLGAGFGAFGRTVAQQRGQAENRELAAMKIAAYKRNLEKGVEEGDPAAVREFKYWLGLSPEERLQMVNLKRQNEKIFDNGGVPTQRNVASGTTTPLSDIDTVASNKGRIASDIAFNEQFMKAGFGTTETVDSRRQPMFSTGLEILGNRVPRNPSAGLPNALTAAGPPQRGQGVPPGVNPDGYPTIDALKRSGAADAAAFPGLAPGGIRPASAGAAERAGESAASKGTSELYNTMAAAAVDAAEGNRALAKVSAIIEQGKITGGPLATPEAIARNVLSEFGISLNRGIDSRNAMVSAVAANRLAAKIMKGGRSLTDTDVALIASAFPSFKSGIPFDQLPEFISMLKEMNDDSINVWKRHSGSMTPEMRRNYPGLIEESPPAPAERRFRRIPD